MKILVVDDEEEIRDVLCMTIESTFQIEVVHADSRAQAIEALKKHQGFSAIVCDYRLLDGTGGEVYNFIKSIQLEVPFILCSSSHPNELPEFQNQPHPHYIEKPNIYDPLLNVLQKILGDNKTETPEEGYCRVHVRTLARAQSLQSDCFLKLSENKYVKIFQKGDFLSPDDMRKYKEKNCEYFYLKKSDCLTLIHELESELAILHQKGPISPSTLYQMTKTRLELIHDLSTELGVSSEVQVLAEKTVQLTVKMLESHSNFASLFSQLKVDKEDYIISHSIVLSHLCCGIASLLGWSSPIVFYKLTISSFLHDISLNNQSIAKFQGLDELAYDKTLDEYSTGDIFSFKLHPENSAKLVKAFPNIPPDVESIVLQHHERPNGTGFPNRLSADQIHPLASILIFAHALLHYLDQETGKGSLPDFLADHSSLYSVGQFRNILTAVALSLREQDGTPKAGAN